MNCLKISEFLCYNSAEDYSYYKYAYDYINTFQNKLDEKIKINNNRKDDNDLQYIKGEIFFLIDLLFLIDKVNNKPRMTGGARRADSIYVSQDVDIILNNASGQENYNSIANTYFRESDAAIILYDITDKKSLSL